METKEQIKQAIAEKISHQGNQIDLGGALDAILNAIVDVLQPVLTAGNNIDISDGVISATGLQPTLTAGENITIEDNVISATGGGGGTVCLDLSDVIEAPTNGQTESKVVDSFAELATYLGISEDETKALCSGQVPIVLVKQWGKKLALLCRDNSGRTGNTMRDYAAAYGAESSDGGGKVGIEVGWDLELDVFSFSVFTNTAG